MKKTATFFVLFLLGSFVFGQATLSFKIDNPRIMYSYNDEVGAYCQNLEWDVLIKASEAGTRYFALQVIFSYDPAGLTNFYYESGPIGVGSLASRYNIIYNTASGNLNLALTSNQPTATQTNRFMVIPTDYEVLGTFKCEIIDPNAITSIAFIESSMNGQQFQKLFPSGTQAYASPNVYEGFSMNNIYLGRIYNEVLGWTQYGGVTEDEIFIDWNTSVNTSIWEGTAAIEQADGTTAKFDNLNLLNGANLNIAALKYVTVTGNLNNTGTASNLTVANGGSLITNGTVTGEGTISTAVAGGKWHLISMPIPGQTANNFLGEYLQSYAEATDTWSYITDETTPLTVGKGYATWASDKSYAGVFNTGDYPLAGLTFGGALRGFNLVGNPYPSGLDISSVNTWGSNITANTWVWDQSISNYQTNLPLIGAGQGFFVQASGAPSFEIPNTGRAHSATGILKSEVVNQLSIHIEGNNCADYTYIRFDQGSTSSYDFDYDTPKMFGAVDAPQLYTQIVSDNFTNLTRNVLPQIDGNDVVKMNLKVGAAGTYTITASDLESFTDDVTATLVDLQAGISQKLNDNAVYTFTAEPTDNEARFLIQFKSATGDVENDTYGIRIYAFNNQAYVDMPANVNGIVTVYDMVGKKLTEVSVHAGLNTIALNFNAANYLISVKSNVGTVNKQVFVK